MEIFNVLIDFMKDCLTYCFHFTESMGYPSYGVAIIILTLAIKLCLTPLTIKQIKSMQALQKVQPKMKALQAKYKDNKEKLSQEMAKLYKESGVNPLSGCLPLIVQMPFLFSIFYALRDYNYIAAYKSFLWLPSLGSPDPYYILPVVSAFFTWLASRQSGAGQSGAQQKMMQAFMPLFIGYISLKFPSGLVIYWALSNFIQWMTTLILNRKKEA